MLFLEKSWETSYLNGGFSIARWAPKYHLLPAGHPRAWRIHQGRRMKVGPWIMSPEPQVEAATRRRKVMVDNVVLAAQRLLFKHEHKPWVHFNDG